MDLSIVITTYNRSEVLERLLYTLGAQTDLDFQVVVAIDGSSDGTEAMLARQVLPFDMKWVNTRCKGYGLAVARNLGILASDGKAVALLDDDSFPCPTFVASHKRAVAAGVITGGPRNPADARNERMVWKMRELSRLPALTPMPIERLHRDWPNVFLIENNICVLRDDFINMGLFSERLKMYGFIGQEFFGRAEFLGLQYQYNPDASVRHHGELVGDNGLGNEWKVRQTLLSGLIRPSLMKPKYYRAQVAWARALSEGSTGSLPGFWPSTAIAMPWRIALLTASRARRALRRGH